MVHSFPNETSRHRFRLLAIPTYWSTRFFPLSFLLFLSPLQQPAGVLNQLQMLNSSIEYLATDSSPLSSRLLCHFLLKSPLMLYLHSNLILRSSFVHFRSLDNSHLIYSHATTPREIYRVFPLHVDHDASLVLSLHIDHDVSFVLSLHIDHEIILFC